MRKNGTEMAMRQRALVHGRHSQKIQINKPLAPMERAQGAINSIAQREAGGPRSGGVSAKWVTKKKACRSVGASGSPSTTKR